MRRLKAGGGVGCGKPVNCLIKSYYVRQLGCAVGGVLVLIAKSEWRGGDQKKMEIMEFDMPTIMCMNAHNEFFNLQSAYIKKSLLLQYSQDDV